MDYTWHYESPLGGITLASDGEALIGLWFDGQRHFGKSLDAEHEVKRLPVFEDTCRWLDTYFGGKEPGDMPLLAPRGTPFQKRVWDLLLTIPFGQTITYGEIARRLAGMANATVAGVISGVAMGRTSARAVGSAVGRNPISIIIPCHRVIGTNSHLTGYAAGIDKKRYLLEMEQRQKPMWE